MGLPSETRIGPDRRLDDRIPPTEPPRAYSPLREYPSTFPSALVCDILRCLFGDLDGLRVESLKPRNFKIELVISSFRKKKRIYRLT